MEKQEALDMIGARIHGLAGAISIYNRNMAEEANNKARGKIFAGLGVIYPIDEPSIRREIARMEAARKDVMKRKN